MQYIITAYDGENMLEKRLENRPRHLENMTKVKEKVWEKVHVENMNVVILNGEKVGK